MFCVIQNFYTVLGTECECRRFRYMGFVNSVIMHEKSARKFCDESLYESVILKTIKKWKFDNRLKPSV